MFDKTIIKLTGVYLAIIMAISLFFSANIYQLSLQELGRGLRVQGQGTGLDIPDPFRGKILTIQEQNYRLARQRVLSRLIGVNLVILAGGGLLSYYLARRTLQPIEEAHEAQSRFTADASHELRTPIAAMQSEIEVALMNPKLTLTQAKNQLHSNLEELAKLTTLSDGLLRLARMENGPDTQEVIALEDVVSAAVSRVLPQAEKKHTLVHTQMASGLKVQGDLAGLTEAVVTILDNAVKYSPDKSEVHVTVRKEQKNAVVEIKDQGQGIRASDLPHIFDRFYRADSARSKQKSHGYGLGLAIAKSIVDMHDGHITVKSKPGKGATFDIKLPLQG